MKFSTKIWVAVLSIILPLSMFATTFAEAANSFKDVQKSHEYYEHLNFVNAKNFITGVKQKDGSVIFDSDGVVKRSHVAKIVIEAANINPRGASQNFSDLPNKGNDQEAHMYLSKAVQLGLLSTDKNNKIRPYAPATREEMAVAISKAFNLAQRPTNEKPMYFKDISTQHIHADEINGLYYAGVTQGVKGEFQPRANLKRSQFVMMIARAMDDRFKLSLIQNAPYEKGIVTNLKAGDRLNVRPTPSMANSPVGKLNLNTIVKVNHATKDGWLNITANNITGYVSSTYIKKYTETAVNPPKPVDPPVTQPPTTTPTSNVIGKVTVPNLNVRSAGNASSTIVDKLSTGQKVTVHSINGFWVNITTPSGKRGYVHKYYLKLINQTGSAVKDRIIVLDPGHGGRDPGSSAGGVSEKQIALDISKRVQKKLQNAGATVYLTRTGDTYPELSDRTQFATKMFAESFVSIHTNSFHNTSASGTEVWYNTSSNQNGAESKQLAQLVQNKIIQKVKTTDRKIKDGPFYVIRNNQMPAILIELGFISNPSDREKMTNDYYANLFADAIYEGIVEYYSK